MKESRRRKGERGKEYLPVRKTVEILAKQCGGEKDKDRRIKERQKETDKQRDRYANLQKTEPNYPRETCR